MTPANTRVVGIPKILGEAVRALGPHRRGLYLLSALAFVQGTLETAMLYVIARLGLSLMDSDSSIDLTVGPLQMQGLPPGRVLVVAASLLAVLLVLAVPLSGLAGRLSERAFVFGRSRVFDAWFGSSFEHRADFPEGALQTMGEHATRTERLVQNVAVMVVSITSLTVFAIGTVIVAPLAALLAASSLVALSLALRPFTRFVRSSSAQLAGQTKAFGRSNSEVSRLSQEIVAFGVTSEVAARTGESVADAASALASVRRNSVLAPTLYQYAALGVVLLIMGLLALIDSSAGLESVGPVLLLMVRALSYAKQLQSASQAGNELAPYLEMLEADIADLRAHPKPSGSTPVTHVTQVEFRDVTFRYGVGHDVLRDVSFSIEAGATVGIVGPSGGGKSTLVQLLLRLRTPTNGSIILSGIDLAHVDDGSLARLIGFVPQDNRLRLATVADNIRFYRTGFSDDDVEAAARAAHLHDELTALPMGYSTLIGPGARDLSGGQRQRLGIARALLGKPDLLVLDEPTSALDARSEELFRDTLVAMRGSVTMVTVAHRPATLEICDRVFHVSGGAVVEVPGRSR